MLYRTQEGKVFVGNGPTLLSHKEQSKLETLNQWANIIHCRLLDENSHRNPSPLMANLVNFFLYLFQPYYICPSTIACMSNLTPIESKQSLISKITTFIHNVVDENNFKSSMISFINFIKKRVLRGYPAALPTQQEMYQK